MVDWSGGNGRRSGRLDCIWIAHGPAVAGNKSKGSLFPAEKAYAIDVIQ
jgi:hypothetical protein